MADNVFEFNNGSTVCDLRDVVAYSWAFNSTTQAQDLTLQFSGSLKIVSVTVEVLNNFKQRWASSHA